MFNLATIEEDLKTALKSRDQVAADTLRGLKTRIQNEKIAKASASGQKDLSDDDLLALVRSEVKRRKEAAESFAAAGRAEFSQKELTEVKILEKYLPPQMSEQELSAILDQIVAESGFTAKDFGKAMGVAKQKVGSGAEGALISKLLKERLK